MKYLGFLICMGGSVGAVLVPPYKLAGIGEPHWGFIFDDIVAAFGQHIRVFDHIDMQMLLMELLAINAIGIAMMLFARR